jgi:GT2 family glycosyltransferase
MTTLKKPFLAILLTCFNRRETTLATLASLPDAIGVSCAYQIILVDDGSTDGTAEAVKKAYPEALVVLGPGNLFWNKGMRRAWQEAMPFQPDFFLWLNDDTTLRKKAIADLFDLYSAASSPKTIVVGCTADPTSGVMTYGGFKIGHGKLSRLALRRLRPDETGCDTMNGNCVLFPASVVRDIGINSDRYSHSFGDLDYGFRAKRAGYEIVQLNDPIAQQEQNNRYIESVSRLTRKNWRFIFTHPKGIPWKEWLHYCREYEGPFWFLTFVFRYVRRINFLRN